MDLSLSQGSGGGNGFRSHRSYPALNHVSLAPLTPRFPIDDDEEPQDYFSARNDSRDTPTRTSYLSSYSVPGTPGVLSHSRSTSRARHHSRSKSSSRAHLSDTSLHSQDETQPWHHSERDKKKKRPSSSRQQSSGPGSGPAIRRDAEWMLRAGIALASSTREEKGQSWLVKRESSTSLVSEGNNYDIETQHAGLNRKSRSGRSTPAAYSRRGSRSRPISRKSSRLDLAMTSLEITSAPRQDSHSATSPNDEVRHFPDFVDERIRAEMVSVQQEQDEDGYASTSEEEDFDDSEDEIDEQELQRLTRERGFGLGSWIDRMVEWTLFGVDEWPLSSIVPANQSLPDHESVQEDELVAPKQDDIDDGVSISELSEANDGISIGDSIASNQIEKPGENGGWEDAGWLLRVVKHALL